MNALEQSMRDWLLDCFDDEYARGQIKELSYEQLVKAINRYYDGGFNSFLAVTTIE